MANINVTLVVACALVDADKRVLIAQRPEGKALAGLWEFPGGKVEPGERPEATLIRELHEEIGIAVSEACLAPLTFASHAYDAFHLLMPLYICRRWDGEVIAREAQRLAWVRANKLREYPMPPPDIPLIPHLIDLFIQCRRGDKLLVSVNPASAASLRQPYSLWPSPASAASVFYHYGDN